jgi:hypothetical protein
MKLFYVVLSILVLFLIACDQTSKSSTYEILLNQGLAVPGFDQINDLATSNTGVYLTEERPDGSATIENVSFQNGYVIGFNAGTNFLNFAWDKSIGTKNATDSTFAVDTDGAGNIYVLGRTQTKDPTTGFDIFPTTLYKYTSVGALTWSKIIALNPSDIDARNLFVTPSGEVYTLGLLAVNPNPNGEIDIAVQKYSSNGVLLKTFTKRFSGFFCCDTFTLPLSV